MASPQKENGYTAIANELFDAMLRVRFGGELHRVVVEAIIRETYGYNRKEAVISYRLLSRLTGIERKNLGRILTSLQEARVLIKVRSFHGTHGCVWKVNKNHESWLLGTSRRRVLTEETPHPGDRPNEESGANVGIEPLGTSRRRVLTRETGGSPGRGLYSPRPGDPSKTKDKEYPPYPPEGGAEDGDPGEGLDDELFAKASLVLQPLNMTGTRGKDDRQLRNFLALSGLTGTRKLEILRDSVQKTQQASKNGLVKESVMGWFWRLVNNALIEPEPNPPAPVRYYEPEPGEVFWWIKNPIPGAKEPTQDPGSPQDSEAAQ